jgi:DNA-binding transcriptional LysR family regulator
MEIKWLEDFVSLAETRSFSRSAGLRHVTQPAFSRRIQALEAWLGAELIDRSAYPTRLTEAGNIFHAQALTMLNQAREARTLLRGQSSSGAMTIKFAVPHTLSLTFFPAWIRRIEGRVDARLPSPISGATHARMDAGGEARADARLRSRLRALNVHDAVLTLTEGGCDLMMGYHHPSYPVVLDPRRYAFLTLGRETMSPFCAPRASGDPTPRFSLPGTAAHAVPYLAYSPDAYLGRMTEVLLMRTLQPLFLDRVYETDMAEGLKSMALAGHGIAFLPHSAAAEALASGRLVCPGLPPSPADQRDHPFGLTMEIRMYRDTLAETDGPRAKLIDAVWQAAQLEQ